MQVSRITYKITKPISQTPYNKLNPIPFVKKIRPFVILFSYLLYLLILLNIKKVFTLNTIRYAQTRH